MWSNWCNSHPLEGCFSPIAVIACRVKVALELATKYLGMNINHVIMLAMRETKMGGFGVPGPVHA